MLLRTCNRQVLVSAEAQAVFSKVGTLLAMCVKYTAVFGHMLKYCCYYFRSYVEWPAFSIFPVENFSLAGGM